MLRDLEDEANAMTAPDHWAERGRAAVSENIVQDGAAQ
jgi:hypothetical protein